MFSLLRLVLFVLIYVIMKCHNDCCEWRIQDPKVHTPVWWQSLSILYDMALVPRMLGRLQQLPVQRPEHRAKMNCHVSMWHLWSAYLAKEDNEWLIVIHRHVFIMVFKHKDQKKLMIGLVNNKIRMRIQLYLQTVNQDFHIVMAVLYT